MFWIEDPTPAEDQSAFRLIRQHTTTPIAVGEVFNSIWDCQQLITERLIDYIRTSVSHAGGITHLRRIFALADLYGVRSGSHGAGDLSPIATGRRPARRPEHSRTSASRSTWATATRPARCSAPRYTFPDGYLHPGDLPGLGRHLRRAGRGPLSVRPEVPAGQPSARRFGARLVTIAVGDHEPPVQHHRLIPLRAFHRYRRVAAPRQHWRSELRRQPRPSHGSRAGAAWRDARTGCLSSLLQTPPQPATRRVAVKRA